MRGIILAGGRGTRLFPLTTKINKQLLSVYDKPMIYYPLATLMSSGIKEILIITREEDLPIFREILGDGSKIGISIVYAVQSEPRGIVDAFLIAADFIENERVALILGDNIFHGSGLGRRLEFYSNSKGAHIFAYRVSNPEDYGVIELNEKFEIKSIAEKPALPVSNFAIPGLYFFDSSVKNLAKQVEPSNRGELEITSLLRLYLGQKELSATLLPRGTVWLDTGSPRSLSDAGSFVRIIEERQGYKIACIEEISWRLGWISEDQLRNLAKSYPASDYQEYLLRIVDETVGKDW